MVFPSEDILRQLVGCYARLRAAHGVAIGHPILVQPTGTFFPDAFVGDAPSVERLLRRLVTYAPIADDLGLELAFVAPDQPRASGCGASSCCANGELEVRGHGVEETTHGYRVSIAVDEIGHPNLLTASLARSVGGLVLHEAGDDVEREGGAEAAEVAAVACGFGVLLMNGAEVWGKSCGGLRRARATAFSLEEVAVALSMFGAIHEVKPSEARANLDASQREAFDLAWSWIESNPPLVEDLRDRPELLTRGTFEIEPIRGAIARWRAKRKREKELRGQPVTPRAALTDGKRRHLEEARALMDEVFPSTTGESG
jgi:hypothetical protein